MNYKVLGIALVVMMAMCGAVSAADSVYVRSQVGGVTPSFSWAVTGGGTPDTGANLMTLSIGQNTADVALITVVTNSAGWTIKAKDTMPTSGIPKPIGSAGKMTGINFVTGAWSTPLGTPMDIKFNGGAFTPITGTDQLIHTGIAGSISLPLNIRQTVVATDSVLPLTEQYFMPMTITGAASP